MKLPIYMDHHATTACDPRVVEKMTPYFSERFGNPASRYYLQAREAEDAVEKARHEVATLIGARSNEIIFTSGATESNNLALFGAARAYRERGRSILTAATEHRAVLDPLRALKEEGLRVDILPVDAEGQVSLTELEGSLSAETILVSVMAANNEIGTVSPVADIGRVCKEREILFHTDAAQAVGKIPIDVQRIGVDLLSLSSHKIYGPKGMGALYVRSHGPRVRLEPMILGGGHERGLRSGTLNVPGIVGFGEACRIARAEMAEEVSRVSSLRDHLQQMLTSAITGTYVRGDLGARLPNNLSISFEGISGESLLLSLADTVAISSGAACTSATVEPSHVLRAIGVSSSLALATLRFGLGRWTTLEQVEVVAAKVLQHVKSLRSQSIAWNDSIKSDTDHVHTTRGA